MHGICSRCSKEAAADLKVYSYKHGFSGFAAKLTESQAQKIAELPGVDHIIHNQFHSLQTTRSWDYLDLSSYSPTNLLHDTNLGDGITIGLLDTGFSHSITDTYTSVIYRTIIENPFGIDVAVRPVVLIFNSTIQKNSFIVTVSTTHKVNSGYYFGSLTWTDGKQALYL